VGLILWRRHRGRGGRGPPDWVLHPRNPR
jgi:hypothetical protein